MNESVNKIIGADCRKRTHDACNERTQEHTAHLRAQPDMLHYEVEIESGCRKIAQDSADRRSRHTYETY